MEINIETNYTNPINTSGLYQKFINAKRSGLRYSGFKLMQFLMMHPPTPVDHGFLSSWYHEPSGPDSFVIKSPAEYAKFQNDGTSPYTIKPRNKKALFWPGLDHPVKSVNHPGLKGKHFVEISLNRLKPLIPSLFNRAFREEGLI